MFTLDRKVWNDGPDFQNFMGPEGAPPVATRHLCCGGGGGSAPNPPDYTNYIAAMTGAGNKMMGWGNDLYNWAQQNGVNLSDIAKTVGNRAGSLADWGSSSAQNLLSNWQNTYGPIYQAQAKRTMDFIQNMPGTMSQWAGKWGADAAASADAAKQSALRTLQGQGLTRPGVAQGAIDLMQSGQRGLAKTAASEAGRMAAMQYGDTLTGQTEAAGQIMPQVAGQQSATALSAGNQQMGAPESAVSTTAGAYTPAMSSMQGAYPYMSQWGSTMSNAYNQSMQQYQANVAASQASNPMNIIAPIAGMALSAASPALGAGLGSFMGPVTQGIMSSKKTVETGGAIRFDQGGAAPPMPINGPQPGPVPMAGKSVPPHMSPSGGQQTDDVHATINGDPSNHAAINVGEFIIPKDVAEWQGEKFFQNLIMKTRKEAATQKVAKPQMGPPAGAIQTGMPMGAPA
jgi:hypothetical protein